MSVGRFRGPPRGPPMTYSAEVEQPVTTVIINRRLLIILWGAGIFGVIEKLNKKVAKIAIKKAGGFRIRKPIVGNNTNTIAAFCELIGRHIQGLPANAADKAHNKGAITTKRIA